MSASHAGAERSQLVVFELAGEQYGLPIEEVQEIIRYSQPRHVTTSSPWITGVINLRGKIVPVLDLARRLGVVAGDDQLASNIVIVDTSEGTIGLIVNHVTEVIEIEAAQIERTPAATDRAAGEIAKLRERLVVLLTPEALAGGDTMAA